MLRVYIIVIDDFERYIKCSRERVRLRRWLSRSSRISLSLSLVVEQMTRCRLFYLFLLTALMISTEAQKGGGGRGGRGRSRGRVFGSRMPILIPHRNPASAHYYANKDVS